MKTDNYDNRTNRTTYRIVESSMKIKDPEYNDPYNDGGRHIRKTTEMKLSNADQLFETKSPYHIQA